MNRQLLCVLFLLSTLISCGSEGQSGQNDQEKSSAATAEMTDKKAAPGTTSSSHATSQLAYIEKYIGQRPAAVELWGTEPLRSMLMELLGADSDFFLEVMQEAMPLEKNGLVYTVGVAPDDQIPGVGYLLIDTEKDQIRAFAIFGDAKVDVQTRGANLSPPAAVRERMERVLGR